jgi:hypothetical protein
MRTLPRAARSCFQDLEALVMSSPIFPMRLDATARARLETLAQQAGKPMATCMKALLMSPAALEILAAGEVKASREGVIGGE